MEANHFPLPNDRQDNVVRNDAPCRRCGYNLRGLYSSAVCPECATPVSMSMHGNLLRFSDPAWLETLAKGTRLILWGLLIAVVVSILGAVLVFATASQAAIPLTTLIAGAVGLYGSWLLTEPDPRGLGDDRTVSARRVIRVCLAIGLVKSLADLAAPAFQGLTAAFLGLIILGGLAGISQVVGEFAKLRYLGNLATRIPDPSLANRAKYLRWAYGITVGGLVLFGSIMAIGVTVIGVGAQPAAGGGTTVTATAAGPPPGAAPVLLIGGCFMLVFGIAALVVGIANLMFLFRMGTMLKWQAAVARALLAENSAGAPRPMPPGA